MTTHRLASITLALLLAPACGKPAAPPHPAPPATISGAPSTSDAAAPTPEADAAPVPEADAASAAVAPEADAAPTPTPEPDASAAPAAPAIAWDGPWLPSPTAGEVATWTSGGVSLTAELSTGRFRADRILELALDVDDAENLPSTDPVARVALYVDDQLVPGELQVKRLADANLPIAVALLVGVHDGYTVGGDGVDAPFLGAKAGLLRYVAALPAASRVAVYGYDEERLAKLADWGAPDAVKAALEALAKPEPRREPGPPPTLYASLAALVAGFPADAPPTRLVLIVSDGHDARQDDPKLDKSLDEIAEAAGARHIRVDAVGFTLDAPEPLVSLETLAVKTGGNFVAVTPANGKTLPEVIGREARRLTDRTLVAYRPKEFAGALRPVTLRVEIETAGKAHARRVLEGVNLGR